MPNMIACRPFYLRAAEAVDDHFRVPLAGAISTSLAPAVLSMASYYSVASSALPADAASKNFHDRMWWIGLVILLAQSCLYYATRSFNELLPTIPMKKVEDGMLRLRFGEFTRCPFRDEAFIGCGLFFGCVNVVMGLACFGVPHRWTPWWFAVGFVYLMVGIVCGMAVWGVYCVTSTLRSFARDNALLVDLEHPDGRGGLQPIGDATVRYALVTFIVGSFISFYVLQTQWTDPLRSLLWFWAAWPHLVALFVLVGPFGELGRLIRQEKTRRQEQLAKDREKARIVRDSLATGSNEREFQVKELSRIDMDWMRVHRVSTFPAGKFWVSQGAVVLIAQIALTIVKLPPP